MSITLASSVASGGFAEQPDENQEHGLLPDLNGVDLVMSLSPKPNSNTNSNTNGSCPQFRDPEAQQVTPHELHSLHHHHLHHHHHQSHGGSPSSATLTHLQSLSHSTPFSVTDILSPIEESYRKLELAVNPPSPYR